MTDKDNYVILTESTTDLSKEMIDDLGVYVEPMTYIIDGEEFKDYPVETGERIREFYNAERNGKMPSTSQINEARFEELFRKFFGEGKDILYIAFSSALSSTYNRALSAAQNIKDEFPERRVVIVDSKCASLGEGLLVYYAAKLKESGKTIDETAKWLEDNKLGLCHWFTVDDLNHLKRGGRVSAAAVIIGTMLGIKPIMHVDDEGRLTLVSKIRGRRNAVNALIEKVEKTIVDSENQVIFISHGDCIDDAEYLKQQLKKRIKVKDIKINFIGPVIGAHSGPGTLAVFFLGSKR